MKRNKLFEYERFLIIALFALAVIFEPKNILADSLIQGTKSSIACDRLLALIEGSFGALLTTAAGIGAIVSAAIGGFRTMWTLVVVSVGAFILRSYLTLFFAPCG